MSEPNDFARELAEQIKANLSDRKASEELELHRSAARRERIELFWTDLEQTLRNALRVFDEALESETHNETQITCKSGEEIEITRNSLPKIRLRVRLMKSSGTLSILWRRGGQDVSASYQGSLEIDQPFILRPLTPGPHLPSTIHNVNELVNLLLKNMVLT